MKNRAVFALLVGIALALGLVEQGISARKYAPEIKEYLDQVKKQRKDEAKAEREAQRADEHRRLRPYQTLEEVYAELDQLILDHPNLFNGGTYGRSVDGRDLRWVRMNAGGGAGKVEILVAGNIHAQELAAGQMVMALLRWFAENYGSDCNATRLADQAEIYFIPILNPDGMAKAANTQSKWGFTQFIRKNVNKVDLNRNFPYPADGPDKLKDEAGSPHKRDTSYRGEYPLSEPETRAFINFIDQHDFLLSLNYHTSGGMILYCPGTYPDPEDDTELMKEMALAYQSKQFDKYAVHPGIDLYPTMGALDDYLYHRYGILAFTVEVGLDMEKRVWSVHNQTFSPVFWGYNVYYLEREAANNVPGALAMIDYAIELHENPEQIRWQPGDELWVGEPPREEPAPESAGL